MLLPPPPPPPGIDGPRPQALYDTECFPNYWLLKLRPRGGVSYSFRLLAGQRFTEIEILAIVRLFKVYTAISFNGIGYDVAMITGALMGMTCEELKALNDRLIPAQIKGQPKVFGAKPWELGLPEWRPDDHIDVMETAPGAGGLKQYAARIHSKTIRDLPYPPDQYLSADEMAHVDDYCETDLDDLEDLFVECKPLLAMREKVGKKYSLDLRSKSDAQMAEAVLRKRCELALGRRIYKQEIDWNYQFTYKVPSFISYELPQLKRALELVRQSVFGIRPPASMRSADDDAEKGKCIAMPPQLEGLEIVIGNATFKMGVGGLHSQEKKLIAVSNATHVVLMPDVRAYYPNLMVNSGEYPPALGPQFAVEFESLKMDREGAKELAQRLKKAGFEGTVEYIEASTEDGGGKIMINGTFGKTGSPYSVLFAPSMLIQTTITGQLSLLMLIEWLHHYGIEVVSANTDGLVVMCPRTHVDTFNFLIKEWEKRTGLTMETDEYVAIYARDVNNYFAIKTPDDVKRKGEYAKSGLVAKKNPDVEICSDAVALFLSKGVPVVKTITECRDIRKFLTVTKVAGGGVKMWGEGPRKGALVRDKVPVLEANGWVKSGRAWVHPQQPKDAPPYSTDEAYKRCFKAQVPEYLGKVVRWFYSTQAPGPILYASNGNTVSLSYGARPVMTLPSVFPSDVDFAWYVAKAESILKDIGYYTLTS